MEQNNPNYKNQSRPSGNSGQQQNQGNYQFSYQGEKLPGDPSAISLGIVSLVLLFIGCLCYGIPAVITLILSIAVLFLWIFLNQKPGIGTVLNALIIAMMIDLCITFVPTPESFISQISLAIIAVITVGLGGGIYLVANLGPGPRDGLMVGLQQKTNLPLALVRITIEITVVSIGWYLGGVVGIGALLFAFGIGPTVALGLFITEKIF